ncbi:MAG: hypothetical protein U0353_04425 [Sandaracinus sp.]
MTRTTRSLLVPWPLLALPAIASLGCDPGPSDPDAAVVDRDSPGGGETDAYVAPGEDAFVPSAGCPTFDVDDPTQISYGRNSPGDTTIDADTTWTSDHTYFVIGSLDVQGATLTIEAGTQVCLDAGSGSAPLIDFREGAGGTGTSRLVVNGTASEPVVFQPATPDSAWNSITLSSDSTASLSHLMLLGGGAGGSGVLRVDDNYPELLEASDVHLVGGAGMLLALRNGGLAPGSSIYLDAQDPDATDMVMEATPAGLATLDPSSLHVAATLPVGARFVRMTSGTIEQDVTIPGDLGLSFVFRDDVIVSRADAASPIPTLTIEAGAEVLFDGTMLLVGGSAGLDEEGGNLVAVGTEAAPIHLGSAASAPTAGDWQGVILVSTAFEPEVTELAHVRVSDAGRDLGGVGAVLHCATLPTPVLGAIRLRGNGFEDYEGPRMTSIALERSAGDGIAFACSSTSCLLTDYSAEIMGTDIAGELLRERSCP